MDVKVQVGNVIEFQVDFEADGKGFAEVMAVMLHEKTVFLVIAWMEHTNNNHPLLELPQYQHLPLFGKFMSAFFQSAW